MRLEVNERGERTGWHLFDVPTMWAFMENQQTDNHWRLVAGWSRAYELTSAHLLRLKTYREGLATAWPPEQSPASAAYCARLDYLIQHVQQVHDVAVANFSTLSVVTTAIAASRAELKKIHDEYEAGYQARLSHERRFKDRNAPTPPNLDFENLPATRRELEELNARARALMSSLSNTLVEASIQIKQPPPYAPRGKRDDGATTTTANHGPRPKIPQITPISVPVQVSHFSPLPSAETTAPTNPTNGPTLGGASTLTPPATSKAPTPAPGPLQDGLAHHPATLPSTTPFLPPRAGLIGSPAPPKPSNPTIPAPRPEALTTSEARQRSLPSGGIIGGFPSNSPPQTPIKPSPASRANPVGGIIGTTNLATQQTRSDEIPSVRQQRWTSDNPWHTDAGVPPVLLPPKTPQPTEPGPTIGYNR
ncbi:hypothetical protein AB0M79_13130 [Polymorphospora sp. NPDC051019]|uniref:hypothetical protein n=1 Tax=Polymorphospora sp. NPDC051019 TaxID=3155725 RepID=UPI0034444BAC